MWMDCQGKLDYQACPDPKENLPKMASRGTVVQMGNLGSLDPQERGVLLVYQGLAGRGSLERRVHLAKEADLESLDNQE